MVNYFNWGNQFTIVKKSVPFEDSCGRSEHILDLAARFFSVCSPLVKRRNEASSESRMTDD
jgi:hypothetical protein